jgi:hypothetical protein
MTRASKDTDTASRWRARWGFLRHGATQQLRSRLRFGPGPQENARHAEGPSAITAPSSAPSVNTRSGWMIRGGEPTRRTPVESGSAKKPWPRESEWPWRTLRNGVKIPTLAQRLPCWRLLLTRGCKKSPRPPSLRGGYPAREQERLSGPDARAPWSLSGAGGLTQISLGQEKAAPISERGPITQTTVTSYAALLLISAATSFRRREAEAFERRKRP